MINFIVWLIIQYIVYSIYDDCQYPGTYKHDLIIGTGGLCLMTFFLNIATFGQYMIYTCIPGFIGIIIYLFFIKGIQDKFLEK